MLAAAMGCDYWGGAVWGWGASRFLLVLHLARIRGDLTSESVDSYTGETTLYGESGPSTCLNTKVSTHTRLYTFIDEDDRQVQAETAAAAARRQRLGGK